MRRLHRLSLTCKRKSLKRLFTTTYFQFNDEEEVEIAQMYFDEARHFAKDNNIEECIYNCKKSLVKSKKSVLAQTVYVYLGQFYLKNNDLNKALILFNEARENNPENESFDMLLGVTLYRMGQIQTSFQVLESLYRQKPDTPTLRYQLAVIYAKKNQIIDARDLLYASLEREPHVDPIRIRVMLSQIEGGFSNNEKAQQLITEAIHIDKKKTDEAIKEILAQKPQ